MPLSSADIRKCWELGTGILGKIRMVSFALLAPSGPINNTRVASFYRYIVPKLRLKPKDLQGYGVLIHPADWSQTVIFEEIFLRGAYDLDKLDFKPEVVFDCGAHIGLFSLLARTYYPEATLISYEPNPSNLEYLRQQKVSNSLVWEVRAAAVSTREGELEFSWDNSHSGRLSEDKCGIGRELVTVHNLTNIIRDMDMASLLLKIDVEGEEMVILPALMPFLPSQTAIFFETHTAEEGWKEIMNLLEDNGFNVEQINERGQFCDGFAIRSPQRVNSQ